MHGIPTCTQLATSAAAAFAVTVASTAILCPLRMRALLARARGDDDVAYRDLVGRFRVTAESLGFEGHRAWADAILEEKGQSALLRAG